MMKKLFLVCAAAGLAFNVNAQTSDDVLNLLIKQNVVPQDVVDSLRADAAIKAQEAKAKQKSFNLLTGRGMTLNGYTQIRFQSFQEPGKPDYLDLRRVRLDLKGNISPTWDYRLQLDFAGSPKILDMFIGYKPKDWLRIQVGQFKVPMSLENLTPSNKMEFVDRSQVVEALVSRTRDSLNNNNGRDLGLQVSGSLLKIKDRYIIDYYIGVFDGQGINVPDLNEMKDLGERLVLHPIAGLDVGGSYYSGYDNINKRNWVRNRAALEAAYTWKDLSIKGEYIHGIDRPVEATKPTNKEGYYAQATYFLWKRKLQACLKYDYYDANTSVPNYENAPSKYDAATYYIIGLNAFFNDYVKLYFDYSYRRSLDSQGHELNKDLISAQLQIGF